MPHQSLLLRSDFERKINYDWPYHGLLYTHGRPTPKPRKKKCVV